MKKVNIKNMKNVENVIVKDCIIPIVVMSVFIVDILNSLEKLVYNIYHYSLNKFK